MLTLQRAELIFSDVIENLQLCQSALNSMITYNDLNGKDDDLNTELCENHGISWWSDCGLSKQV